MENDIQVQYMVTRLGLSTGMPIAVLNIDEDKTAIAFGTDAEPEAVLVLSIGSKKTAVDFFKHTPPTPGEMETAIMVVEDEVIRAGKLLTGQPTLFTKDVSIRELALIAGVPDQPEMILSLEAVERTFDCFSADIPIDYFRIHRDVERLNSDRSAVLCFAQYGQYPLAKRQTLTLNTCL